MERYERLGEKPLGKGMFGEVWKARKKDSSRKIIALKILKIPSKKFQNAALKEVEILKKLSKPDCFPTIVCYYDAHEEGKTIYIEMEYIDGETLDKFARERRFKKGFGNHLLALLKDILPALIYLHTNGIIHRDIKPENIMIDRLINPKLIDIGVACDYRKSTKCKDNCCFGTAGTPYFMPPELLEHQISYPSTDIWSLGATLYTAYNGQYVFKPDRENFGALRIAAQQQDIPEMKSGNKKLNKIVELMLKKDHKDRPTANEILQMINEEDEEEEE